MPVLRTFVQISDLHIGDLDRTGNLVHDPFLRTLWTLLPFFTGLAGHERKALVDLADFFEPLRKSGAVLLLTGDLTSTAKRSQFDRVIKYVEETLPPPTPANLGLKTKLWLRQATDGKPLSGAHEAIPGNHDHWPGRRFWFLGGSGALMRRWRPRFPCDVYIPLAGTPLRLRFLSLNSDAGVWGWSIERILARGSFQAQVRSLAALLKEKPGDSNEIRVLLVHHSLSYRSGEDTHYQATSYFRRKWYALLSHLGRRFGTLEMNKASRGELYRLLARENVPIVLTGHIHKTDVRYHSDHPTHFLEARCGTTTQLNFVPSKWPSVFPDRQLHPNTLLVHEVIQESDGRVVWKTETWTRDRQRGFVRHKQNDQGEPFSARLVLSPR